MNILANFEISYKDAISSYAYNKYYRYYILTRKFYYTSDDFLIQVLEISNNENKPIRYVFNIGAKEKGCVSLEVMTPNQTILPYTVAYIIYVKYNKDCNISGNLESGMGTRHMILVSLNVAIQICPWIEKFEFDDASARMCHPNGPEVSLSYLYIALYGKTWYEKHFDAVLKNEQQQQYYSKALKKLKSKRFKHISNYDTINPIFGLQLPKQYFRYF